MSAKAFIHNYILSVSGMSRMAVLGVMVVLTALAAMADDEQKTMLIINSYNANAPWSQSFTQPINKRLSEVSNVHVESVNLNSAEITDSAKYYNFEDRIFEAFKDNQPSYVIMVGNFAFMLRDRIQKEWGDIPMLLISRIDKYAPLYYYFAGYEGENDWSKLPEITEIRDNYNMTMIETPDFVNENIDLMVQIIPNMDRLVFIGDRVFTNRSINNRIESYIKTKYPGMKYEWLKETADSKAKFQDYMLNRYPTTGFLISTWDNPSSQSDAIQSITGGNLHMISSAANPIFSLRASFLSLGAFGGVYCDGDKSSKALAEVIDRMLDGEDMRYLPLYIFNNPVPTINHQRMKAFDYEASDFPDNTEYIFRAPTVWEAYGYEIFSCALILLLLISGILIYMNIQRKRIAVLKTLESFIKQMPWAYSKANILYRNGKVYDIEYDMNGMNSAFLNLLSDNLLPDLEWKMFPLKFISEKVNQLIQTGNPVTFTYHFDKTDTYYEFLLCRINPERLRNNELPNDLDIFANNITKRKRAEAKLRTTMRALDITLNVARIIPWQWDIEKGMIFYDGFRTMHHLSPTQECDPISQRYSISETNYISNVHDDDRQRICDILDAFKTGKINHKRTEFKIQMSRNGKVRTDWVEINAAVTEYSDEGKPLIVMGSLLVITERKKQEEALVRAKEQASQSDRMKSAFLANMSHEIRTPLNAIVGFSSLITQTDDREQKAKYSGIIAHNNDLLLHLINDVLDLAKIESNTLELHVLDTDLNDLMRQIYDTVRLRIAPGVVFNMVLGAEECTCRVDPNRLTQVLINLLTNAAKFTQKGSIAYGYEINGEEIEFFVRDTGIGISKENQEKLFKRFSKLNNFKQGTGLGLSICKSFVELMGGQIWVKSRGEGKGSSFLFTLPYVKCDKGANLKFTENAVIEAPAADNKEITILVAEDNDSNYVLFDSILSKHYNLIHACNGREAVEMYKRYKPNLILMDIRMPEMDGYEATREIRKISQNVPIIAVTAHAFVAEKDKIMKSGFNCYVAKPINQNELIKSVKTQLSKRFFVF